MILKVTSALNNTRVDLLCKTTKTFIWAWLLRISMLMDLLNNLAHGFEILMDGTIYIGGAGGAHGFEILMDGTIYLGGACGVMIFIIGNGIYD